MVGGAVRSPKTNGGGGAIYDPKVFHKRFNRLCQKGVSRTHLGFETDSGQSQTDLQANRWEGHAQRATPVWNPSDVRQRRPASARSVLGERNSPRDGSVRVKQLTESAAPRNPGALTNFASNALWSTLGAHRRIPEL